MGRHIALLLGNTEYDDPGYPELVTPEHNVRDFAHVLKDPERCGFEVIPLINAPKAKVERHILDLFKNKAQDDFLIFYFAGHGLKDSDGALYFAMKETENDYIESTAIAASFVKTCIDKSHSESIVVILDCCYSGTFADILSGYGRSILTATDATQHAWDTMTNGIIDQVANSVFTQSLVEGITTGDADADGSGEITIEDLFTYAYARTVKLCPKQTPLKKIHQSADDLVLARNVSPRKLSNYLLSAITDPNPYVRSGVIPALDELLYLYDGKNPHLVEQIQAVLKQLSSDPNGQVSQKAHATLDAFNRRNTTPSNDTKRLTVFIASPDDVMTERESVRHVIAKLNSDSSISPQAQISIRTSDDPNLYTSILAGSATPTSRQEKILPEECDIVVIILWSKLGAPLPTEMLKKDGTKYESMTEWAYENAMSGARHNDGLPAVLVYRSNQPVLRRSDRNRREKIAQFRKVEHFFSALGDTEHYFPQISETDDLLKGYYKGYNTIKQFEAMLEKNLRVAIRKLVMDVPSMQFGQAEKEVVAETTEPIDAQELLESYLNWIIEQHSQLQLQGLGGDTGFPTIPLEKVYVALKGSRASTYEREQSQELLEAEILDILTERGVEVSAASLALLLFYAERRAIILNPYMPSLTERDRPGDASIAPGEKAELITLGDAFCKERWIVILGDPGSGKTTLARWLALKLATAWLDGENSVVVPTYQVDPNSDQSNTDKMNIGPTRLPVLLRVSEFSEAYQKARKNFETLSIADFLGFHSWRGQPSNLPKEKLNAMIKHYLQLGRVIVILDGMDEITAASQRDDVVRSIETFINDWVNAKGNTISAQEKSFLWNPMMHGEPATSGGNQIIITSRIAGYQAKPITGQVTHVTIQPMQRIAVEHFCESWTLAIHQLLNRNDDYETVQKKAEAEIAGLKAAIFDPARPRVRELASNPLLVTILALVYRKNHGHLPEQRTELYHTALEILIETWRSTGMTTIELIYVLSPLAAHIHQHYSTGRIEESEMKEIITDALARYRQLDVHNLPPAFVLEVDNFVRCAREDVGILAESSDHLYSFLHLTFQEYLAALNLIQDKWNAAQAMVDKLDDPRWREPILMALGHISSHANWGPEARQHLLTALLDADDPLGDLIPRSALLIVSAIPEMARVSEDIVRKIIRRLLTTYADQDGIGQFSILRERISSGFKSLYNSKHKALLEQHLAEALFAIEKGDRNLALAAASLVFENKWHSASLFKALLKAFPYDDPAWDYPITQTLQAIALLPAEVSMLPVKPAMSEMDTQELVQQEHIRTTITSGSLEEELNLRSDDQKAQQELEKLRSGELLASVEETIHTIEERYQQQFNEYSNRMAEYKLYLQLHTRSIPIDAGTLPFRKTLEDEPELVDYIENNLSWLRLIVLLYGGISDNGLATYAIQHDEITAIFHMQEGQRKYYLQYLKEQSYWREGWATDDVIYNLAVYLDTENGKLEDAAARYIPRFSPLNIFNDSPLTFLLLDVLRQKKQPAALKDRLWQEWHSAHQDMRRVHALLALLVIDTERAIDTLTQNLKEATNFALTELLLNQLRVRKQTLTGALILLAKRNEIGTSLQPLQNTLTIDRWGEMVDMFFRTFSSVMSVPIQNDDELLEQASSIPRLNAEIWAYWLSGMAGDDPVYSYAVVLDTMGKKLESATALINMYHAYNSRYNQFTHWHPLFIPPVYDNNADIIGEAFTVAHQSRSELMKGLFYAGTITFAWLNHQDYPELKEDALAATLLIPVEFQQEILQDIDAQLAEQPDYASDIIERVVSIADDVIRARALWRITLYKRYWKELDLWKLAIKAADQIQDSLHRSRAFERLLSIAPQKQREQFKNEALQAARAINDPNNQARALARLALYESNEKRWSLLTEALAASSNITNEQQKVDTLQLLYPYFTKNYQLNQTFDDMVNQVEDDWYRHKGKNLLSIDLLTMHEQLHEQQKLTPVLLAAFIDEVVNLRPEGAGNEDLWRQLLDATKRDHAITTLLKTAAANGLEGLYITPDVFDVIRALLDMQEIAAIYILLPYLRGVDPSLIPFLAVWVDNPPDTMLWAYAGLLLAEVGQVNANTIPCLIELIENGIDFARYRASLILHGSAVFVQKKNRDFHTSQLGMEALLLLAQAQKRLSARSLPISMPLAWSTYNMIHDDPLLLPQLIQYAEAEEESEGGISSFLRQISYCNADFLNTFIEHFERGSEHIQTLLLNSWLMLAMDYFRKNITPQQQERMEEAIAKLPTHIQENTRLIPKRLMTIPTHLCNMGNKVDEQHISYQEALDSLNQGLFAASMSLLDTSVEELGKDTLYKLADDPINALNAARQVSENGTALELLFAWLAARLRENIDDFPVTYYLTSTLLEIAGAVTRFSPAAVYNLCEKNELGPLLVQATMYHKPFWGRAGAATLLGYLRQTPEDFDEALLSGLQDIAEVQTAIIQMVQNLRYLDERMIPRMIDLLAHESSSVVYAISRLLVSIARDEKIQLSRRQEIVRALNTTIQQRDSVRPVFNLDRASENIFITTAGRLDQQLYSAITDIIGIV